MGNWLVYVCIYFLLWRCWTFSLNSHSPYVPHYCSPITMISPLLVHVSWLRLQNFSIFLFPPFPVCPASLHLHFLFLHSCLRLAWGVIALLVSHTWAPARLPAAWTRTSPVIYLPLALVPHCSLSRSFSFYLSCLCVDYFCLFFVFVTFVFTRKIVWFILFLIHQTPTKHQKFDACWKQQWVQSSPTIMAATGNSLVFQLFFLWLFVFT